MIFFLDFEFRDEEIIFLAMILMIIHEAFPIHGFDFILFHQYFFHFYLFTSPTHQDLKFEILD